MVSAAQLQRAAAAVQLIQQLHTFRASHPVYSIAEGDLAFKYFAGGDGTAGVVILPGLTGSAESMFTLQEALEPQARVISLGFPAGLRTGAPLLFVIGTLLDMLEVDRPVLLGLGRSAVAARAFAAQNPKRVKGLILSKPISRVISRLEAFVYFRAPENLLLRRFRRDVENLISDSPVAEFWRQFYEEELEGAPAGQQLRNQYAWMADLLRSPANYPEAIPTRIVSNSEREIANALKELDRA